MTLNAKLKIILQSEMELGNDIVREYHDAYAKCRFMIMLKYPFRRNYERLPEGVEYFSNKDSHYPLGNGYYDTEHQEMLFAPFV